MPSISPPPTAPLPMANPAELWWETLHSGDARSAQNLLANEIAGGRHQRSVYELFAEMEEKDGHLFSTLQTRVNGLLGLARTLVPADASAPARAAADFAAGAIDRIPRFEELLRALLDSLAKGFSAVELVWDYDDAGRLIIADWIAHPQEYFLFDSRGRLHLLVPPFRGAVPAVAREGLPPVMPGRVAMSPVTARRAPMHKFALMVFGRDARNPYGRGLCHRAYWFYHFKKANLGSWSSFNARFGSPLAVGTLAEGASDEDREHLLAILRDWQAEAGIVLPETVTLRLLESGGRGDGRTFRELLDWCNDEISKIVLGATLTTGEGRRSGSLALGNVHNTVRHDYIESDARLLAESVAAGIIAPLVALNFPAGTPPPRWRIDATPPADLEQQARIDRELVALGVPLPIEHFYQAYARRRPEGGERALSHDDSNLFQYHLRYGILTINEVRKRLHLPPVPWGERPAGDSEPYDESHGEGFAEDRERRAEQPQEERRRKEV